MKLTRFIVDAAPRSIGMRKGRRIFRLQLSTASNFYPGRAVCPEPKNNSGVAFFIPLCGHYENVTPESKLTGRICYCNGKTYRITESEFDKSGCRLTLTGLRSKSFAGLTPAGTLFQVSVGPRPLTDERHRGKFEVLLRGSGYNEQQAAPTASKGTFLLRGEHVSHWGEWHIMEERICQVGGRVFEVLNDLDYGSDRCVRLKPRPDLEPFAGATYAEYKKEIKKAGKARSAASRARHQRRARNLTKRVRREHGMRA